MKTKIIGLLLLWAFPAFKTQATNQGIGSLYTISEIEESRYDYPTAVKNLMENIQTQIVNLQGSIDIYSQYLDTASTDSIRGYILQQINALQIQQAAFQTNYDSIYNQAMLGDSAKILAILAHAQGLDVSRIYEANTRTVNAIYYATFARKRYSLDATQLSILQEIAGQCPSAGGPAVYQARAMLMHDNGPQIYNDFALCAIIQSSWRQANIKAEEAFSIFPNPTTGEIFVHYGLPEENQAWYLCDLLGKELANGVFSDKHTEKIDISGYISGIYLLKVGTKVAKIILQ